jgi:hypothetical protein
VGVALRTAGTRCGRDGRRSLHCPRSRLSHRSRGWGHKCRGDKDGFGDVLSLHGREERREKSRGSRVGNGARRDGGFNVVDGSDGLGWLARLSWDFGSGRRDRE